MEKLFTKANINAWEKEDCWAEDKEFLELMRKYNAKIALYKGVLISENYAPLNRFNDSADLFAEAEKKVLYAWNLNDFSEIKFNKIVNEIKLLTDLEVRAEFDCGGL